MIGIYKITSPSGKIYIGQSRYLKNRISSYRNLRCKNQPKVFQSLRKYGWNAHKYEIIVELPKDVTQEVLNTYEIFYWQCYIDCGFEMLNTREPGSEGKFTSQSIKKREESRKRNGNTKRTLETKQKIGSANKGKAKAPRTLEHRQKLSEAHRGKVRGKQKEITKQRRLETRKNRHSGYKKIIHIGTNTIYSSRKEAAAAFNWSPENVNHYLKKGEFKYL